MKPGESFDCPHCGKSSFLKKESIMNGWTKVGEILACAACSKKIADYNQPEHNTAAAADHTKSLSKLASFLSAEPLEKPQIHASEDEKHFCKNCKFYIIHPFNSRCSKNNREMSPMDDCPAYQARPKTQEKQDPK